MTSILDKVDDDVLSVICLTTDFSLKSLSLTCKRLRAHCVPRIFDTFQLNCYGEGPWDRAMRKLATWNPSFSPHIRQVIVHLQLGYKEDPEPFDYDLPSKLADTLALFSGPDSRVNKMTMIIDEDRAQLFGDAFVNQHRTFPSVQCLVVGPYNDFMVQHCPNVKTLSVNDWVWSSSECGQQTSEHSFRLIAAAASLQNLTVFVMTERWSTELLEALHKSIPTIETLAVQGGPRVDIEDFVSLLSQFRHVKVLSIAGAWDLRVGFNPPRCGNVYRGPGGKERLRRVEEERAAAEKRVATKFFDRCNSLKELWFDSYTLATIDLSDGHRGISLSSQQKPKWIVYEA